jgi:hypothetical protein
VLERAFGQVPEFDVRGHLNKIDGGTTGLMTQGGREAAFRDGLNKQFEHTVGETLERIFPAAGRLKRLYTEEGMWRAWWKNKRKNKPSVCDWVVDCGSVWLCLDANNRRLTQTVAGGFTDPADLDTDLNAVLAEKKASQMASTIKLLTTQLPALAHRDMPPGTTFVPLIVIPDDGLPWNFAVHDRVQELLKASGTLQSERGTPLGVVTLYDLGYIERAAEDGRDAGALLAAWRSQAPELPLQNFLDARGIPLRRPRWETETFDQLTDDLLQQMTGGQSLEIPQ